MAYLWDLFLWKITSIACLSKLELKSFLVFLIFKSSFTAFCDCVSSSNMIKKVLFLEKQFTNRFNSFGNMIYINRKLKWSQNQPTRNLHNEVSLKTCFLEFLNFENSELKWFLLVEANNFKVINIVLSLVK